MEHYGLVLFFDYETFSQNSIRVEVRDEHNASMVKDFVVQIADDPSDNQDR